MTADGDPAGPPVRLRLGIDTGGTTQVSSSSADGYSCRTLLADQQ